jgi:hypothetical protein
MKPATITYTDDRTLPIQTGSRAVAAVVAVVIAQVKRYGMVG